MIVLWSWYFLLLQLSHNPTLTIRFTLYLQHDHLKSQTLTIEELHYMMGKWSALRENAMLHWSRDVMTRSVSMLSSWGEIPYLIWKGCMKKQMKLRLSNYHILLLDQYYHLLWSAIRKQYVSMDSIRIHGNIWIMLINFCLLIDEKYHMFENSSVPTNFSSVDKTANYRSAEYWYKWPWTTHRRHSHRNKSMQET
jgi:hypothetical protein